MRRWNWSPKYWEYCKKSVYVIWKFILIRFKQIIQPWGAMLETCKQKLKLGKVELAFVCCTYLISFLPVFNFGLSPLGLLLYVLKIIYAKKTKCRICMNLVKAAPLDYRV